MTEIVTENAFKYSLLHLLQKGIHRGHIPHHLYLTSVATLLREVLRRTQAPGTETRVREKELIAVREQLNDMRLFKLDGVGPVDNRPSTD